jgi:threonine/homoserine/homoserine lactone efflux protein
MSVLIAMISFSLVMSISPGPVNMITMSIGAASGSRKALPFVSGATIGFTMLLLVIGVGLGEFATNAPYFMAVLNVIGTGFIVYIGYKIATSDSNLKMIDDNLPNFTHGFLLQWLNPKAWAACFAGVALFSSPDSNGPLYTFVSIYLVICFVGIGSWAVLGDKALSLIKHPTGIKYFNHLMGGTLIAVALLLFIQPIILD